MKKLYGILLASLVITTGNLIANYDPPKTVNTDEDFLLWLAFEKPIKFDPTSINDTERTQFIDKGLNLCSKNAHNNDVHRQITLCQYYHQKKWYVLSNHWAYETAKNGVIHGMESLCHAYAQGNGVIQDDDEAFKWAIIATLKGSTKYREILSQFNRNQSDMIRWHEMAKEWGEKNIQKQFLHLKIK